MSTAIRTAPASAALALVLAAALALAGCAAGGTAEADAEPTSTTEGGAAVGEATTTTPTTTTAPVPDGPDVLLVWASGGLPPGLAPFVPGLEGVEGSTLVLGDELDLVGSTDAAGATVDRVEPGWKIPVEVFAVDPATYPAFVADEDDAAAIAALAPGEALLSATSAELRRVGPGARIELATGAVTVAGIVADESVGAAEVVVGAADAARLGVGTERFVLVAHEDARTTLDPVLTALAGEVALRLRSPDEVRWLRHSEGVAPAALVKEAFGEFSLREAEGRNVQIDPAWVDANIARDEPVPILGLVTCHRAVIPALRAALTELEEAGLGALIDPADYAGCWSPRRIAEGEPVSRHAWGIAIDINVDGNPRGDFATQDRQLVDAMARQGFTWGGEWLFPDPAHYEVVPDGA